MLLHHQFEAPPLGISSSAVPLTPDLQPVPHPPNCFVHPYQKRYDPRKKNRRCSSSKEKKRLWIPIPFRPDSSECSGSILKKTNLVPSRPEDKFRDRDRARDRDHLSPSPCPALVDTGAKLSCYFWLGTLLYIQSRCAILANPRFREWKILALRLILVTRWHWRMWDLFLICITTYCLQVLLILATYWYSAWWVRTEKCVLHAYTP